VKLTLGAVMLLGLTVVWFRDSTAQERTKTWSRSTVRSPAPDVPRRSRFPPPRPKSHVNANDIAVLGARPLWFFVVMLLPESRTKPELAETIMADVRTTCEELGVTLGGGHTEITQGLDRPILVGQMLGEIAPARLVRKTHLAIADLILLTRGVAIEGSAILAQEKSERLRGRVDANLLARAAGGGHTSVPQKVRIKSPGRVWPFLSKSSHKWIGTTPLSARRILYFGNCDWHSGEAIRGPRTPGSSTRIGACHAESSRSLTQWLFDKACLVEGHDILMRRSMPNRFMREISVVRLIPMRAAAPSGPPTRPLVTLSRRTISSRSWPSRVPATTGACLPLWPSSPIGA
jgi:AIR synthase related protein, N-terminal domain